MYSFQSDVFNVVSFAGVQQATDGNLYGSTSSGGVNGDGDVFRLQVGFGPFVKTLPLSARVGTTIRIFGTDLTGATSVTFKGTPAAFFRVVRPAEIIATVPDGATTGTIQVTTPAGLLFSGSPFDVRQ